MPQCSVASLVYEGTVVQFHPLAVQAQLWLQSPDRGSSAWWRRLADQGAPLLDDIGEGRVCVSFLWRDPQGDEAGSLLRAVYIDVNSVTDHHSPQPQTLWRIPKSDIWLWQVELVHNWRGSYCLMPATQQQLAGDFGGGDEAGARRQREWWRSLLPLAQGDPLNRRRARRDASVSALHLPAAPAQPGWEAFDRGEDAALPDAGETLHWHSAALGVARTVWLYACGAVTPLGAARRPLVVLLDGQRWQQDLPLHAALDAATASGRLPPALYVFVDAVDGARREQDLACSAAFWHALGEELLPQVAARAAFSAATARRVVAGQSLGGLAALYAGLHYYGFGALLSQSGSFWWPYLPLLAAPFGQRCARKPGSRGLLCEQLEQGLLPLTPPLRVWLEVGSREDVMIDVNQSLCEALRARGHAVHWREFEGGHDALCWRGGLVDGLSWLLGNHQIHD